MIKEEDLPDENELPVIFVDSTKKLIEAGYEWVGIDHFAKKNDQLAIAKLEGKVYRNFGGETPGYTKDIMGLGPTSTGGFGNYYFQNKGLKEYMEDIKDGRFSTERGYVLTEDDILRREVIFSLQCNQIIEIDKINKKYNIEFKEYFKKELVRLRKGEDDGMLIISDTKIESTIKGRYFIRHMCQIFDTFFDWDKQYEIYGC